MIVLAIARNELRRLFASPLAWTILALVQFLVALFFFILLSQYLEPTGWQAGRGLTAMVVGGALQVAAIILLLITPFITMRLFSEEYRSGTIALLFSAPVSISELVLGKYLGALAFFFCALAMLALMPLSLLVATPLDIGLLCSAGLALALLVMALVAIGLFISSLTEQPALAALSTFGLCLVFWLIHIAANTGNAQQAAIFGYLSLLKHYESLLSGMFSSVDVIYYLLVIVSCIALSIWRLDMRRTQPWPPMDTRAQLALHSIAQIALLLIFAGLLAWMSTRYVYVADWTRDGRHGLSAASLATLSKMDDALEITAYAREQVVLRDAIKKFVARYQRNKDDIVLRFVNPDAVPDEVRNLAISVNGELVLRYKGRSQHVRSADEQAFTNALSRLLRSSERWLVFIEGHGERHPLGKANHDLGLWAEQLAQRGFRIQPLNLSEARSIPENTSVLILAGPAVPYLPGEVERIRSYLDAGGNLLWLHDPGALHGLEPVAALLGIAFPPGTIIDSAGRLIGIDDPTIALVTRRLYGEHPTLNDMTLTTLFPQSTAITSLADDRWQARTLLSTGDHTWQETGALKGEVALDDTDLPGPLAIGLGLEREVEHGLGEMKQQRIVVLGDGDFLANTYVGNSGNMELGLRLINWLSDDDALIAIPATTVLDAHFAMGATAAGILGVLFVFILPLALFAIGLGLWWRRRTL